MPKGERRAAAGAKEPRRKSQFEFDDDEASVGTGASSGADAPAAALDPAAEFAERVEQLTEKRASSRLAALKAVADTLRAAYEYDLVDGRADTLIAYSANCLKKASSSAEAAAACDVLNLVLLTLGADGERLVGELSPLLEELLRDDKLGDATRAAAVQTFALLHFVDGEHGQNVLDVVEALWRRAKPSASPELLEEALKAWGLLASLLPKHQLVAVRCLPDLSKLLDAEAVEVRQAAGENIAMCFAAYKEGPAVEAAPDADAVAAAAVAVAVAAEQKVAAPLVDMQQLAEKVAAMSTDGSRHRAKRDRRVQRSTFREILQTVEDGTQPMESLRIGHDTHEFEGWPALAQLDALRTALGAGLQAHLASNPLLADVLGLSVSGPPDAAAVEGQREARRQQISASRLKMRAQGAANAKKRRDKQAHLAADE